MFQNSEISLPQFLAEYWQKKPLLIRNALPNFCSPISPEEMAGLSLEDEVESRIVIQHDAENYELKTGPFSEQTYAELPENNWTLLVQGMDKLIPEVTQLLDTFNFIPSWRIDDIMVSYATTGGNVGPHYDHYDVFLLQAQGKRQWTLTAKGCEPSNFIQGVDLRLMQTFEVEETHVCQPGDILYLPPKWGHHGVSLSEDCQTYSIGYRTYKGLELWDSLGDYLAENEQFTQLYQDPNWQDCPPGEVNDASWQQAKQLLQMVLDDEQTLKHWFGRFATQLDAGASQQLPDPLTEEETPEQQDLVDALMQVSGIVRDPVCRFAYTPLNTGQVLLNINGAIWQDFGAEADFIKILCNQRIIEAEQLQVILQHPGNQALLQDLWELQFYEMIE